MDKEYRASLKMAKVEGYTNPKQQKQPAVRLVRKVVEGPWLAEGNARGHGDEDATSVTSSVASSYTVVGPKGGVARPKAAAGGATVITRMEEELDVFEMGFTRDVPIDWAKVNVPPKQELARLLESRIESFEQPDVLVKIGDHEYRCHMMVLQSYSEFFDDQNVTRVELPQEAVSKYAFAFVYHWMLHKGQGSYFSLTKNKVLEVLAAAQYLKVKELEHQCWQFVENQNLFSEDQAFLLYLEAKRAGNPTVMELMVPRVRRFFLTLVASKEFVDMEIEEVERFLSSSYVCVRREMDIFMAGVRWLTFDWEQRRQNTARVMGCVRFGLVPPWHLVDVRRNPAPGNRPCLAIARHPEVARMIDEGLAFSVVQYQHPRDSAEYKRAAEELSLKEPHGRSYTDDVGKGQDKAPLYEDFLKMLHKYKVWYLNAPERVKEGAVGERGEGLRRKDVHFDTDDLVLLDK